MRTCSKSRDRPRVAAWFAVACALFALLATSAVARAEPSLDVAGKLAGVPLGRQLAMLEDPGGTLTFEDVQAAPFRMLTDDAPNFGYSSSTYWVRLRVDNHGASERDWLLELAYPHLDDVTLYEPRASGFRAHETGDLRPFASRDVQYRTFVFELSEP
ncbi:MAG TPA: 7TM-DISM domain-containing protein, partial [Polyangiales bacterium]|nr:7TM-DISM domain-containing protein [Polyangiales bacterium]